MSVWTEFEGTISFHEEERLSVSKAFHEYYDGVDVLFNFKQERVFNYTSVQLSCAIEQGVEIALPDFLGFLDILKEKCKHPQCFRADVNVNGRILK